MWSLIYFGPTVVMIIIYMHIFVIIKRRGENLIDSEYRKVLNKNVKVSSCEVIQTDLYLGGPPGTFLTPGGGGLEMFFQHNK